MQLASQMARLRAQEQQIHALVTALFGFNEASIDQVEASCSRVSDLAQELSENAYNITQIAVELAREGNGKKDAF